VRHSIVDGFNDPLGIVGFLGPEILERRGNPLRSSSFDEQRLDREVAP